jgi:hypothetical protein
MQVEKEFNHGYATSETARIGEEMPGMENADEQDVEIDPISPSTLSP